MPGDMGHESEFVGNVAPLPGLPGGHPAPREHGALRMAKCRPPEVNRAPQTDQGAAGKHTLKDAAAA